MPSRCIFECSVVRLSPSRAAAPVGPAMTPPDSLNARRIASRSAWLNVAAGFALDAGAPGHRLNVLRREHEARARQDHRPLDDVLQLPDIARPAPSLQRVHHLLRDGRNLAPHAPRTLPREMQRQRGNVVDTLAQRRDRHRKDIQAIVEIGSERSVFDHLHEIAVRRRDDPHVHLLGSRAAEALELALLQDAQQLGLHFRRDVADLVQEQRAAGAPARDGRSGSPWRR